VSAGQASLGEIKDCPQDLFLFGNRFRPQIGGLQYLEQPWASEGVEVPEQKFLITTYRGRGGNRMGRPLLKEVFWPSWFKRNVLRLWLRLAEKGPGTAVVRYNDPDNVEEKRMAAEVAQAIIDGVAIAIPKTLDLETELLKIARLQDPAVYERLFQQMQYSIARRVMGETQTAFSGEGGKGTQALGTVHSETFEQRSIELCRAVETVINLQIVRPLVLWNFGPAAPVPTWSFDTEQEEDLLQRLTIDAGLQRMGKKFTVGYVVDRYDVPLAAGENPEQPTDVLIPNSTAPNVNITDQARATFAEPAAEAQAHREMGEFDKLFERLRKDSMGVYKERVAEIAREAHPVVRPD
jgi:phage gp29-like protein